jgi:hypothetical protein
MNLKITYLTVFIFGILSCRPSANNHEDITKDTIPELPEGFDTTIQTNHFSEYLDKKYTLDPVQLTELNAAFQVEEHDSIKTSSLHLNGLSIEYTYTQTADSGITELKVNGVKRTFIDEEGKPTLDYGDLNVDLGTTLYTIAGEKYILVSCSPIDAVGWLSKVAYGMLIKLENSNTVMQLSTYYYPGDTYLNGDFYLRQDRFTGKVFYLIAKPASFDKNSNPDNIFLKIQELHL